MKLMCEGFDLVQKMISLESMLSYKQWLSSANILAIGFNYKLC